jgi:L-gulono-1,4-lactone dehydrogenase
MSTVDRPRLRWTNWAGNQRCAPSEVVRPSSTDELVGAVRQASEQELPIKVVGTGHSFTDIACTDGVQISLDRYDRVLSVDESAGTATVQGGIRIRQLNEELAARGLALENLGDISYQTLAGAAATSTHGTGGRFGGLATQIVGLEHVGADGTVTTCSAQENPDVLEVARVGLGALGIVSTLTVRCVPSFRLHAVEEPMRFDELLERFDELVDENDHFEAYWVPHTGWTLTKANNRTDEAPTPRRRVREVRDRIIMENVAFGAVCRVGRSRPSLIPWLARALPSSGRREFVERSDRVFTTARWVRFCEMEYAVPREAAEEMVRGVRDLVERSGLLVSFPVEIRVSAADDITLSTSSGRRSCYVAVHMYKGTPYEQYFRAVESLACSLGGRPHWGKIHFQTAETLRGRYPGWDRFQELRRRMDPAGRYANAYTDRVLGPVG